MCNQCHTPYKQAFDGYAEAMAALQRQQTSPGRVAIRVYKCTCGAYHVTGPRRPVTEERRKRGHRRKGGRRNNRRYRGHRPH